MTRVLLLSANLTTAPFPVYPLGMAVVAEALVRSGHEVEQFDLLAEGGEEERLWERLRAFEPRFVALSLRNLDNCDSLTATPYPDFAKALVARIRTRSAATIILGGPAFSILPEELLAFIGGDYGVVGEGERLVCELIEALEEGIPPAPILRNKTLLKGEELGTPRFESRLVAFYQERSGMVNFQTKRGCAHGCIYCSYPTLEGKRYRFRDPRLVVEELKQAQQDHGAEAFFFTDAVFNDDQGHYLAVVEELLRQDVGLRWCCYIRPQGLGRHEVALMKRSGLFAAELGTDAACDRTLRSLGKGFTFQEAWEVNEAFVAERVPCAHFVMFGGPDETLGTVKEGLANLDTLRHTVVFAYTGLRILPDTPLHVRAVRDGVLAADAPLRDPVFYHSPQVDRAEMESLILASFKGRRDRVFPPERGEQMRVIMERFGRKGLLWDSLIAFPKEAEGGH